VPRAELGSRVEPAIYEIVEKVLPSDHSEGKRPRQEAAPGLRSPLVRALGGVEHRSERRDPPILSVRVPDPPIPSE
jgi:hypothetical protein